MIKAFAIIAFAICGVFSSMAQGFYPISSTINADDKIAEFRADTITYDTPVKILDPEGVYMTMTRVGDNGSMGDSFYEDLIATASLSIVNGNKLVADFGGMTLQRGRKYTIMVSAGTLAKVSDPTSRNAALSTKFEGDFFTPVNFTSSLPTDTLGIPDAVTIEYQELPKNISIKSVYYSLYTDEVNDDNFLCKVLGTTASGANSTVFSLEKATVIPGKKHIMTVASYVVKQDGNLTVKNYELTDSLVGSFIAPTREQLPLSLEFTQFISDKTTVDLNNPTVVPEIKNINDAQLHYRILGDPENKLALKVAYAYVKDNSCEVPMTVNNLYCECKNETDSLGNTTHYIRPYSGGTPLFAGRDYEFRILAEDLKLNLGCYANYIDTSDVTLKITGTVKPEDLTMHISSTLTPGETLNSIYGLRLYSESCMEFVAGKKLTIRAEKNSDAADGQVVPEPREFEFFQDKSSPTYVNAHFDINAAGDPIYLEKGLDYTFEIPAGIYAYMADNKLTNAASSVTVRGGSTEANRNGFNDLSPVSTISVKINGRHSFTTVYPLEAAYDFAFSPAENWRTEAVSFNGQDITAPLAETGKYTISSLPKEANFEVKLTYTGKITVADGESNVAELAGSRVKVAGARGSVEISGLNGGEQIVVYDLNGAIIASQKAFEAYLSLPLNPGIYLVRINQETAKIRVL